MAERQKAILDTDPGIDDILAVMLAYASPEVELLGVTTVAGNCPLPDGTSNMLAACQVLGAGDLPVVPGCWRPLARPLKTQKDIYGKDEAIGLPFNENWKQQADQRHAVNFLLEQVSRYPGEVTLYPLAPLTNIATAILMDPAFTANLKEIILMGGAARVPGNTSAFAEFNFWVDPEAARVVFESGIPITMVGLDVTGKTALWVEDAAELDRLDTPITRFIRKITRHYHDRGRPCYLFDPLAVGVGIRPAIIRRAPFVHVDIETKGEFAAGTSLADLGGYFHRPPNAKVCLEVDSEGFRELFWQRVVHYQLAG